MKDDASSDGPAKPYEVFDPYLGRIKITEADVIYRAPKDDASMTTDDDALVERAKLLVRLATYEPGQYPIIPVWADKALRETREVVPLLLAARANDVVGGLRETLTNVRQRLVNVAEHQCTKRGDYLYKGHPDAWIADSVNEIDASLSRSALAEQERANTD